MNPEEIQMHLAAGRYYGRLAACGKKIKHPDEETAVRHAGHLNKRHGRLHDVEAYPCYWCSDLLSEDGDYTWHVGREMTQHERDLFSSDAGSALLEMEEITINVAEASFGIQQGLVGLRVHNRKLCEGRPCSIHHPSGHHMNTWPLNWRGDRRIMERVCDHGIGHPDPDDADFRRTRDGDDADPGIHGCDGCCFKGGK